MKIYLAGPCDTDNRTMMVSIAKYFREHGQEVFCPFELKIENAWDYSQEDWARLVFEKDIKAMNDCDLVVAISPGRIGSGGTNWEIGYAYGRGIPVHVIQIENKPTSLMIYCGCTNFINHDPTYSPLANELQWICEHGATEYHGKCKTILT